MMTPPGQPRANRDVDVPDQIKRRTFIESNKEVPRKEFKEDFLRRYYQVINSPDTLHAFLSKSKTENRLPSNDSMIPMQTVTSKTIDRSTTSGSVSFKIGIYLKVDLSSTIATLTITGPEKVYFAVGFNATHMRDQPYTIYVNSKGVQEQQIGTCGGSGHCAGTSLESSITVVSEKVVDNKRTVILTRPLQGRTQQYNSFNPSVQSDIPMIVAVGHSDSFSTHKDDARGHLAISNHAQKNVHKPYSFTGENSKQPRNSNSVDLFRTNNVAESGSVSFKIGIYLKVDLNSTTATLTITGPEKEYFAVGFNATHMRDEPYTIYVNSKGVHEQQIGTCGGSGHCAGTSLESSVTVVSDKAVDSKRTVILTRPLQGRTQQYYSFDSSVQSDIPMIAAVGHSDSFSTHKDDARDHLAISKNKIINSK